MAQLGPTVDFDDRLTLVEHLDELRSRVVTSIIAFVVVLAGCFWQNHALLKIASGPLPDNCHQLGTSGCKLATFGVSEAFTTTLTISAYAAIVITLPILLYEIYAFTLPALSPGERRMTTPFVVAVPFLFVAGVVFAYFVIVPAALKFLIGFNHTQFNNQLRAKEYYSFFATTEASVGLLFQVPIGILAITRLGIITPQQLSDNRRYAVLVIAIIAMLLPGTDPVTMLLSMLPLLVLYEGSVFFARLIYKSDQKAKLDPPADGPSAGSGPADPDDGPPPPSGGDEPPNGSDGSDGPNGSNGHEPKALEEPATEPNTEVQKTEETPAPVGTAETPDPPTD